MAYPSPAYSTPANHNRYASSTAPYGVPGAPPRVMAGHQPRVLVADNDDYVLHAITHALVASGMAVYQAKSGADVNTVLSQCEVDVLVSDIGMPGNEDLQLLRSPAVASGDVRVILMTGAASVATAVIAVRCGVTDYLEKPFSVAQLVQSIERAVQQRRERMQLANFRGDSAGYLPGGSLPGANDNDPLGALSPDERGALSARESEVAVLIGQGMELQGIASTLHISPNTVRNHFRSIYRKLDVNSLREVVFKLLRGVPRQ